MEYTINKISKITGISSRTLRYYEELDLLKPLRISSSKYRIYGQKEIDRLQLILFYKEFEIPLLKIKQILDAEDFDEMLALEEHRNNLQLKLQKYNKLICTLDKTIMSRKENKKMKDIDKFEGFKDSLISENDKVFGNEVREKFGSDALEYSNKKIKNMSKDEYDDVENLRKKVDSTFRRAFEIGDHKSDLAMEACELHKNWIMFYWKEYSKDAHLGLAKMYTEDERFTAYYDKNVAIGSAKFIYEAMKVYVKQN